MRAAPYLTRPSTLSGSRSVNHFRTTASGTFAVNASSARRCNRDWRGHEGFSAMKPAILAKETSEPGRVKSSQRMVFAKRGSRMPAVRRRADFHLSLPMALNTALPTRTSFAVNALAGADHGNAKTATTASSPRRASHREGRPTPVEKTALDRPLRLMISENCTLPEARSQAAPMVDR